MSSDEPGYPESGDDFLWDPLDEPIDPENDYPDPNEYWINHEYRMHLLMERAHKKQRAREIREEREQQRIEAERRLPWIFWTIFALLVTAGAC